MTCDPKRPWEGHVSREAGSDLRSFYIRCGCGEVYRWPSSKEDPTLSVYLAGALFKRHQDEMAQLRPPTLQQRLEELVEKLPWPASADDVGLITSTLIAEKYATELPTDRPA